VSEGWGAAMVYGPLVGGGGALQQLFLMRSARQLHGTATAHSSLYGHLSVTICCPAI